MAKRKTKSASTSKRLPPSVPTCVKRCEEGYCTDFILTDGKYLKFTFKKVPSGYLVYKLSDEAGAKPICLSTDISVAPTTRVHFNNLTSLSKAVEATESWIGAKLPKIR